MECVSLSVSSRRIRSSSATAADELQVVCVVCIAGLGKAMILEVYGLTVLGYLAPESLYVY